MWRLPCPRWLPHLITGLTLLLVSWTLAFADEVIASRDPLRAADPAAAILTARLADGETEAPTPIGTAQCLACHGSRLQGLERSHPAMLEFAPEGMMRDHSCEVCHGPGSVHTVGGGNAVGILNPLQLTGEESNAICLSCHASAELAMESEWHASPHNMNGVACVTCHDPHRETPHLLRPLGAGGRLGVASDDLDNDDSPLTLGPPFSGPDSQLALDWHFRDSQRPFATEERFCLSCHTATSLDFKLRSHHPVEQADFSCTTCHDPHTNALAGADLIRRTNGLCESCHTDYAGPFLFDHAPVHDVVMGDGCLTCHQPHGSTNDHLLRVNDRGLCLQCHFDQDSVGPEAHFPGSCWASECHAQVHGSQTQILYIGLPEELEMLP